MPSGSNIIDMTGQKFGHLVVLMRAGSYKRGNVTWRCRCACGAEVVFPGAKLRAGKRKSCGCMAAEFTRARMTTHGETGSRLFRIWGSMKTRCTNPKSISWKYYGALGVKVCETWLHDYLAFSSWARENGYADNLTLDRIDPCSNYGPENCRWATYLEQRHNRRKKTV